jgi:hypothetical protein
LKKVLFCNASTSWQELKSFLYRLTRNENKELFALIGPERLDFENQDLFLENLAKLTESYKAEKRFIKLALISSDGKNHIHNILSQNFLKNIKLVNYSKQEIIKSNHIKELIESWQKNQTLVTSFYSGLGKSTYIKNKTNMIKQEKTVCLINHTISDCANFITLAKQFRKKMNEYKINTEKFVYNIHFDILSSNQDESLNEFLFMAIFFKVFKVNDYTITTWYADHFFVEIANTFKEVLREQVYIGQLFTNIEINEFDIQKFQVNETEKIVHSSNYIQIVCNYLKYLNENKLNTFDFIYENEAFSNMSILDDFTCSNLLEKYFIKKLKSEQISFTQILSIINILAFYLKKFTNHPIFLYSSIKFLIETTPNPGLVQIYTESRQKIVENLIELAINHVTNSVVLVRKNQNAAEELVQRDFTELEVDEHRLVQKEFNDLLQRQLVSFEKCNYLMIVFAHDDSLNLVYSNKNILLTNGNITSLLKSQDMDKFKKSETLFLKYLMDANDLSNSHFFPEYLNERHEDLLKRLDKIFNLEEIIKYKDEHDKKGELVSKYNKTEESCLFKIANNDFKDLIDFLNEKSRFLIQNLKNYVLTPDNFLKMILISTKINSNLPVVVMGETGCGKTSLIGFLALKILKLKLIVFNLHAGISQREFIKRVSYYVKLVEKVKEEIWLFFDEFNTSECMYLITKMVCNRTFLGHMLPSNLKLLAACNPYKIKSKTIDVGLVTQRKSSSKLLHIVHPLPDTLIEHIWDYGVLTPYDEKNYIKSMIFPLKFQNPEMIQDLLFFCHQFIRDIDKESSSVSLRDIERFRIFYQWFNSNIKNRPQLPKAKKNYSSISNENKCIVLAIIICYYLRISQTAQRGNFLNEFSNLFKKHKVNLDRKNIQEIYEEEQNEYLNRMNVPKGIARNNALKENVFATFICIMNKIPIFICGKPGCSKTLTLQLLLSSLLGKESKDPWFKELPGLFAVTYQGNLHILNIVGNFENFGQNISKF